MHTFVTIHLFYPFDIVAFSTDLKLQIKMRPTHQYTTKQSPNSFIILLSKEQTQKTHLDRVFPLALLSDSLISPVTHCSKYGYVRKSYRPET